MFKDKDRKELSELLEKKDYDTFFKKLDAFLSEEHVGQSVQDIQEEWRKLHIAKRNGLMDDEQIHLAMTAYYTKKGKQMLEIQEED